MLDSCKEHKNIIISNNIDMYMLCISSSNHATATVTAFIAPYKPNMNMYTYIYVGTYIQYMLIETYYYDHMYIKACVTI